LATISTQRLMSLARRGATATKKKGKKYRHKKTWKNVAKKAGLGVVAGLAISIPLTLAGRHFNEPLLIEAGQRVGSVASTAVGGTPGNAAYQTADAIFDRVVVYQGSGISGSQGQVYL